MKIAAKLCVSALPTLALLAGLAAFKPALVSAEGTDQSGALPASVLGGPASAQYGANAGHPGTSSAAVALPSANGGASATILPPVSSSGTVTSPIAPAPLAGATPAMPQAAQPQASSASPMISSIQVSAASPSLGAPLADKDAGTAKVPDSVKSVVKRLNTATEDVSLEDLNSAREAVAKLDILIDIEKRLNDLASLRQEREEKSASSLSSVIPASALGGKAHGGGGLPVPSLPSTSTTPTAGISLQGAGGLTLPSASAGMPMQVPSMVTNFSSAAAEVDRLVGAAGRYTAYVKDSGGKTMRVSVGEKMPDGSIVKSISSSGVTVLNEKTGKTKVLKVKDAAVLSVRS